MVWKKAASTTACEPDAGEDASSFAAAREILRRSRRLAVAFSGGVDSAVLLHLAIDALGGANVLALHARSLLFPEGRHRRICDELLADFSRLCLVRRVDFSPLEITGFTANPPERCYLCKKRMYGEFLRLARQFGAVTLADGINADDDIDSRPGWRAMQELAVAAPLREAGIGKAAIRVYARRHGLINHDLPSQSCLATRFAPGLPIDEAALRLIARLEADLGESLLSDFRLRLSAAGWGIEVRGAEAEDADLLDEAAIRQYFRQNGLELAGLIVCRSQRNGLIEEKSK